jgi:hypothetical protein
MTDELPEWRQLCRKCGEKPVGPGGVICPECRTAIEARVYPAPPRPEAEK